MAKSFIKLFFLQQSYQTNFHDSLRHGTGCVIAKSVPKAERTSVRTNAHTVERLTVNIPVNTSVRSAESTSVNSAENTSVRSAQLCPALLNKIVSNNKVKTPAMPVAIVEGRSIEFSRILKSVSKIALLSGINLPLSGGQLKC